MQQQPLPLFKTADKTFQDYLTGENSEALQATIQWANHDGPWFLALWGESGVGKSHLIQAALRDCASRGRRTMYLPLKLMHELGPDAAAELGSLDDVGIDDLDAVTGDPAWETAIFNLFNAMHGKGGRLLISMTENPRFGHYCLADLKSRLSSGLGYSLHDLNDEQKIVFLQRRSALAGLEMSAQISSYIVNHHRRNLHELEQLSDRLFAASLDRKRGLTVPLVKEVIAVGEQAESN
ncbi:MAG: DnaA regulatory inactivator Hda [Pseudomonadota bacterium]